MSSNPFRICGTNFIESATLAASNTAAGTSINNLISTLKNDFWRSSTISGENLLTFTWTDFQIANFAYIYFTNLSVSATVKAYFYTNVADGSPFFTTPVTPVLNSVINPAAQQKSYAYGYSSGGILYFADKTFKKLVIGITDTSNPDGYHEVSKAFVGKYVSFPAGFERGQSIGIVDESKMVRSDSADGLTDSGIKFRRGKFKLSVFSDSNRTLLLNFLRYNAKGRAFFLSMFPQDSSQEKENLHTLVAKLSDLSDLDNPFLEKYVNEIIFEEA